MYQQVSPFPREEEQGDACGQQLKTPSRVCFELRIPKCALRIITIIAVFIIIIIIVVYHHY